MASNINLSISCIMPMHNEEKNAAGIIAKAENIFSRLVDDWEMIIVESGSTDDTLQKIKEAMKGRDRMKVFHQQDREGMGSALRLGYRQCTKDIICHLEADSPFDFVYFKKALPIMLENDCVIGFRVGPKEKHFKWSYYNMKQIGSLLRVIYHLGYNVLLRMVFGLVVRDVNFSFKMFRRACLQNVKLLSKGWFIDAEILLELKKIGILPIEMPVEYMDRTAGNSTVNIFTPFHMLFEMGQYIKANKKNRELGRMYKKVAKIVNYLMVSAKSGILYRMPVLFPLLEIKPASCNIMITNRCNLRCVMCEQWKNPGGDELSKEDWKSVMLDLKKTGIRNLHFTGGEPLLRTDIAELVAYGSTNGFTVGLTTNGLLLKKDILDNLVASGLRSVVISIDGLGDAYEKVRGVAGSFNRAEEAVRLISEAKKRYHVDASINFTLTKDTIDNFRDVKKFAGSVGLPVAVCLLDKTSAIFKSGKNIKDLWVDDEAGLKKLDALLDFLTADKIKNPRSLQINFTGIKYIRKYFCDPLQRKIPCIVSQDRIIIDSCGNLLGGCMAMGTFGNVKRTAFSRLRKDKRYIRAKRSMFYKKCPGCSCGYLFNIRMFPPLILREFIENLPHSRSDMDICRKND